MHLSSNYRTCFVYPLGSNRASRQRDAGMIDRGEATRTATLTVTLAHLTPIVDLGVRQLLSGDPRLEIVGVGLGDTQLELTVSASAPDVVMLGESGASASLLGRLATLAPGTAVLVLAHVPSRASSMRLLALGATGCLSTDLSAGELLDAIRLAAAGTHVFTPVDRGAAAGRTRRDGIASLTPREREVLTLLGAEQTNAQIAYALHISTETVRTHAARIYRKLGVVSRVELAGIALTRLD